MRLSRLAARLAAAAATCAALASAHATPVALELSLVIDVSGSISSTEYNLQRQGYQNAFLDISVQNAILSHAASGGVAVNVIQFAQNAQQSIGWTLLTDAASINTFAAALGGLVRSNTVGASTDIRDGMSLAISSLNTNSYEGTRRVIDVSGDGHQSAEQTCSGNAPYNIACGLTQAQRDAAAADAITINGLTIESGAYGANGLTTWYTTNVKTSDGFVVTASGFADFERAAIVKIGTEIVGGTVPEPGSLALVGLAGLALGAAKRRRPSA